MNLNHLQYFRVLAKEEHFTRAADMLSITQPSLSHAISNLEKELGVMLFEKIGRNAKLTKCGELFLRYVEQSLEMLEEGEKVISEVSGLSGGYLDIGYIYTLGSHFIPKNLKGYLDERENKHIHFSFGQGTTTDILEELKKGKYRIAFTSYQKNEPDLAFYPVAEEELVIITPRNHELSHKKEVDLVNVVQYPFVAYSKSSGLRPIIEGLFRKIRKQPDIVYEGIEDSSVAGLVASGFGIAIVPNLPLLKTMEVDILKISSPEIERYIYMVTHKKKKLTLIEEDFIEYIKENNLIQNR
ncbi:MAG: LysR family transcriptional regulator [Anaerostipes sp.]|nr:LysR family transcriptional regulator [Anaerostipes sp.]